VNPKSPVIRYWIDAQDRVIWANGEWAKFAAENDGGHPGAITLVSLCFFGNQSHVGSGNGICHPGFVRGTA
jgi:hypothetical protein